MVENHISSEDGTHARIYKSSNVEEVKLKDYDCHNCSDMFPQRSTYQVNRVETITTCMELQMFHIYCLLKCNKKITH